MSLSDETRELLLQVSTATLCTQMKKRGYHNVFMHGVRPLKSGSRMVGVAFTLRYIPMREDLDPSGEYNNRTNVQRLAVESVESGQVLVVDARADTRSGVLGNILAARIEARGAAGIVTDGCFRDSPTVSTLDIPTYAAAMNANLSNVIHFPSEMNVPVACGGVAVLPGDVLVGDDEGVVVLPASIADEVARDAHEQEELEEFIFEKVRNGSPILGVYPAGEETLREFEQHRSRKD